ncbi:hypothetical protein RND81_02G081900 [Saponaria officinalis]|uniref:Uncharacterized protein n=1 Tax=Saponaria officinalis TaxID=3572 RepID=A0AAW1MKQ7_SAPOF
MPVPDFILEIAQGGAEIAQAYPMFDEMFGSVHVQNEVRLSTTMTKDGDIQDKLQHRNINLLPICQPKVNDFQKDEVCTSCDHCVVDEMDELHSSVSPKYVAQHVFDELLALILTSDPDLVATIDYIDCINVLQLSLDVHLVEKTKSNIHTYRNGVPRVHVNNLDPSYSLTDIIHAARKCPIGFKPVDNAQFPCVSVILDGMSQLTSDKEITSVMNIARNESIQCDSKSASNKFRDSKAEYLNHEQQLISKLGQLDISYFQDLVFIDARQECFRCMLIHGYHPSDQTPRYRDELHDLKLRSGYSNFHVYTSVGYTRVLSDLATYGPGNNIGDDGVVAAPKHISNTLYYDMTWLQLLSVTFVSDTVSILAGSMSKFSFYGYRVLPNSACVQKTYNLHQYRNDLLIWNELRRGEHFNKSDNKSLCPSLQFMPHL